MKTKSLSLLTSILFATATLTLAATNDLSSALQKGLFEEEANHNLEAAIAAYQSVATQFDKDRKLAATAIFRLGEVYRKQGKTNEASAQYERVVREFSDQQTLAELAQAYLRKNGGATIDKQRTSIENPSTDEEEKEIRRIKAMIKDSPDLINALRTEPSSSTQNAPLHLASKGGQLVVAEFLLASGADVNRRNGVNQTPLSLAAANGHRAMVALLIAKGANVDAKSASGFASGSGQTALHAASSLGFRAVAQVLLESKADVNAKDENGRTPLHLAASRGNKAIGELLLAGGANVDAKDQSGQTPLMLGSNLEMAKFLITNKASVNARADERNFSSWTALHFAISAANSSMVELLLKNGADMEMKVSDNPPSSSVIPGSTPLQMATIRGQVEIAKVLLEHKANPNSATDSGGTPLHYAANKGNREIAELLLAHGAAVDSKDKEGSTPLYWAIHNWRKNLVEFLLDHKADPNLQNKQGQTLLGILKTWGATSTTINGQVVTVQELKDLLEKFGANEKVERLIQIAVTRDGAPRYPIFYKGTNSWNRFSLLEAFGAAYLSNSRVNGFPQFPASAFRFPSLTKVKIHRLEANGERVIAVDLEAILKSGDCPKDMWLEWGDVIEIPEADHKVNESWKGFPKEILEIFPKCLARQVSISVKGETKSITLAPLLQQAAYKPNDETEKYAATDFYPWLNDVVSKSGLLRTSSDKTRVKVTRINPVTKKSEEQIFNLEKPDSQNNLWLRDGDVVEIPEKP
ncbi:MAG: ankyrin repeat domain-containing protein [Verrucomicrobiota bacterium]